MKLFSALQFFRSVGEPKYDIRDWSPDGTRMGKGISLSHDEMAILKGLLDDLEL